MTILADPVVLQWSLHRVNFHLGCELVRSLSFEYIHRGMLVMTNPHLVGVAAHVCLTLETI